MLTNEQRGVLVATLMRDGLLLTQWSYDMQTLIDDHNRGTCDPDCPVPLTLSLVVVEKDARPHLVAASRS
jgi:hypothetical protein